MKKILSLLFVFLMLFAIVSCGTDNNEDSKKVFTMDEVVDNLEKAGCEVAEFKEVEKSEMDEWKSEFDVEFVEDDMTFFVEGDMGFEHFYVIGFEKKLDRDLVEEEYEIYDGESLMVGNNLLVHSDRLHAEKIYNAAISGESVEEDIKSFLTMSDIVDNLEAVGYETNQSYEEDEEAFDYLREEYDYNPKGTLEWAVNGYHENYGEYVVIYFFEYEDDATELATILKKEGYDYEEIEQKGQMLIFASSDDAIYHALNGKNHEDYTKDEIESIRDDLRLCIERYESYLKYDFIQKAYIEIDNAIYEIKNNDEYSNNKKLSLAQALEERVEASCELQMHIYELRDMINSSTENGLSSGFAEALHEIIDNLEQVLVVTDTNEEKDEYVCQAGEEIASFVQNEYLFFNDTVERVNNEDILEIFAVDNMKENVFDSYTESEKQDKLESYLTALNNVLNNSKEGDYESELDDAIRTLQRILSSL